MTEIQTPALLDRARDLHQAGDLGAAHSLYREVLRREPGHSEALHLFGLLAMQAGDLQAAVALLSQAIAAAPTAVMLLNRAVVLSRLDRAEEALADCVAAVLTDPNLEEAYKRHAGLLQALDRRDSAIAAFTAATLRWPMAAWPRLGRADALLALGRSEDAFADYEAALSLGSNLAAAQVGRGVILSGQLRLDDALHAFDTALSHDPANVAAQYNRGLALRKLGRTREAAASSEAAIALSPDLAMAHVHLAVCRLQLGELESGFGEYEWRKRTPDFVEPRYDLPSPWASEPLVGKRLYIYPERFLGDMIQFCRYALLAERSGAQVTLAAQESLHALLRSLSPSIELVAEDDMPEAYDFQCALLSLPHAFGAAVPTFEHYLSPEPARAHAWRERLGDRGFKIGICWQGSTKAYAATLQRSFPLAQFAALAAVPGVRLISLQKHDGLEQIDDRPHGMAVEVFDGVDTGPDAFLDTAAMMAACDLVVTADTAVAHLAGALGVPVWVALPSLAEWRWMEDRSDTPWYPSMRLFRQPSAGDWDAVFADMAAAIARKLR